MAPTARAEATTRQRTKKSRDDGTCASRDETPRTNRRVLSSTFSIERASTETRRTARDSFVRFYCSPRSRPANARVWACVWA